MTLLTNSPLEGSSVVKVRMASTSVLRGKARVASREMVERESSSLKVPCLRWVRVSATPWASRTKKLGGVDEDGAVGVFGLDFEAVEDGLGEGLADGELFGCVGAKRSGRPHWAGRGGPWGRCARSGRSGLRRSGRGRGRGRWSRCRRGGSGCRGTRSCCRCVEVRNLEVELAAFGVPVEGKEAVDVFHAGGFAGDGLFGD